MTFQYNSNATYSTEDLASSNSTVDLVTQKVYLNESESVQLKFMDILKDHVYFHVYYHMRLILYRLKVTLPREDRYKKANNPYLKEDYFQVCEEYGVDPLEKWLFGDWYYTEKWAVFCCNGGKRTKVAPPKNLTH